MGKSLVYQQIRQTERVMMIKEKFDIYFRNKFRTTSPDDKILTDETIKYKDVTIGLKHQPSKRKQANHEAITLLDELKESGRTPTEENKKILNGYTGNGGLGGMGSEDEYYTPDWLASNSWDMLGDLGEGAKVLDPSSGMGIFAKNSPSDISLTQIELDGVSAQLNALTTDKEVMQGTFQEMSYKIDNNSLDGVITNVPFASVDDMGDDRFTDIKRLEQYFIIRSLELLKPTKRAVFLVPTGVIENTKNRKYKEKILDLASFVGGVRLPNKVFSHTGADVTVDILIFEKHREDVVRAIADNYVTYPSKKSVIMDNSQNDAFYNGTYFRTIGKNNQIGKFLTSEEFTESHFLGQTAHPKSTTVTTLSLDEIKTKVATLTKQEFKNTVKYDNLELLGNVSIVDKLAVETLRENDNYRAYFQNFNELISERKITVKELKTFADKYKTFAEKSTSGQLLSMFAHTDLYLAVMAINYTKWEVSKTASSILEALCFINRYNRAEDEYEKHNRHLKKFISKQQSKKFRESSDFNDKQKINENIADIIGRFRLSLMTSWDTDKNEPIEKLDLNKFQSLEDTLAAKGVDLVKAFDNGGYKADVFTPKEILEVEDIFLAKDGKIIPSSWVLFDGASYESAIKYVEEMESQDPKSYGLTEDEFRQKLSETKNRIIKAKHGVSLDSLDLSHEAVQTLVSKEDMPLVISVAKSIINSMDLAYVKKDSLIKTQKSDIVTGSKDGAFVTTTTEEEIIDFPTNLSISSFYAKNWEDNFKKLWKRHENEIKKALKINSYADAYRKYEDIQIKYKGKGGRTLQEPYEFYGKLKPIINKDILQFRNSFDIELDTRLKLNPTVSRKIKEGLDKKAVIKIEGRLSHDKLQSLSRWVNKSIIESNHGYQNEDIRHFATALKGVNGQDTGLGKSRTIFMSALLAVTSNRVKKALVVVPTSVYDKWVMEIRDGREGSEPILANEGVELVAFTTSKTSSIDWAKFSKSKTKRIMLMPHSVFETFAFKEETINDLFGTTDEENRANRDNKDFTPKEPMLPDFNGRDWRYVTTPPNNSIGYFEDGKIEFVIVDEGQMAKNSSTGGRTVKFASSISSSRYGVVLRTVQAIINNQTFKGTGQGVVVASATPFTSSPLEIYTTLKNTGGLQNFQSFSAFEKAFLQVAEREEVMATDPTQTRLVKVFEGLKNLTLLEQEGLSGVIYRNAETESKREVNKGLDKSALKPDEDAYSIDLEESSEIMESRDYLISRTTLFKEFADEYSRANQDDKQSTLERYRPQILKYGLDVADRIQRMEVRRKSATFSLVHGLSTLAINKDMALNDLIKLDVSNLEEKELKTLEDKIKKTKVSYKDIELYYNKDGEVCEREKTVKVDMDEFLELRGLNLVEDGIMSIPTVDEKVLNTIFSVTKDTNLLKIEDYPKYKAVLENISKELEKNPNTKQLIFSISIVGARILEYFIELLYQDLKIKPYKVMSALNIKSTDGALAKFQEEYNNSKISTCLIFTTKNSTGVDFNKMTQAIHLVDIPYTPDVEHQAKGRGVRQGNKIQTVRVYKYSATGSLDTMKKILLGEKSSWQEDIKHLGGRTTISSIQVDGKRLIAEVLADNPNATEEDIKAIIKEKQEEREAIVAQEREMKIKAVKQAVLDANKLIAMSHETDADKLFEYLGEETDFKGSRKSVDIFDTTTGQNVLKNIKTNGYKVVQLYVADIMSSNTNKDLGEIDSILKKISIDKDSLTKTNGWRDYRNYLITMLASTQYDKSKKWYRVSSQYSSPRVEAYTNEEVTQKREYKYTVTPIRVLTNNQYQEANMLIEEYLDRAKKDVHTKILSLKESKSIFKEAVKNSTGIIPQDEEELYSGLLNGSNIITIDDEIERKDNTVKIYKKDWYNYIEVEPNRVIGVTSYENKPIEISDEFKYLGRQSKDNNTIAEKLEKYREYTQKTKEDILKHKEIVEKHFNVDWNSPKAERDNLKPITSLTDYFEVLEVTEKLNKDLFRELRYVNEDNFNDIENDILTFGGETIAIIDGEVLSTSYGLNSKDEKSDIPTDQRYQAYTSSSYIDKDEDLEGYNFYLLQKILNADIEDIKRFIETERYSFNVTDNKKVIFPIGEIRDSFRYFTEKKDIEPSPKTKDSLTYDEVKDLINGGDSATVKDLIKSIMNLELEDEELVRLGKLLNYAKDGKVSKYGKYNDETKPIGVHLSHDLNVVVTNSMPLSSFKNRSGRGAWQEVGITYSNSSKKVYELNGEFGRYSNTWEIIPTQEILDKIS